ncbi:hypothetical protein [Actinomyces naeslundii]
MASPSTSPCSAVVSASISRSGHDLLTDFAWHSGLFATAAATTWVGHRFFTIGLPTWVFAALRIWNTIYIIDLTWTARKVLEPRDE